MGLTAWSKIQNLRQSLDVYIQAQLASTFAEPDSGIDFEGVPFNDAGKREWLQVRLLEPVRPPALFHRQVSTTIEVGHRGQSLILIVNLNIFVRPRLLAEASRTYRLQALRDTVLDKFTEFTKIDVTDYAGDSSALGKLVVDRIDLDRQITAPGVQDDLRQWSLGVECRWIEQYT